jgi:drug/metabolite transporter (DMT)-like permease
MKEQVSKLRWLMVVGGLIGAMLVIRPGGQVDPSVGWMALTVVLTYAVFQAVTSHMTRTEDPAVMQLYTGWVGWAVSTLLVANAWVTPQSLHEWTLLLVVGLAATLGQYLLIVAFSKAPASVVSPFLYTGVGFSTLMGWWLFDHMPDALAFTGMGLVVLCNAWRMPARSACALWGIGRTAGWIAHTLEQRLAGFTIRPRGLYQVSR